MDTLSKVQGPLHGIPICVKDDHNVIGMDTTLGLGKNLNKPALTNGALVQALADLGATVFCKTNVPQTLFRFSSDNPIYGETLNHRDPILSPGGSSCGSASLVAAGGAVFATGTDIAGSVRIPAHFSGLCTLKPTQNRISDKGILPTLPKLVGRTFPSNSYPSGIRINSPFSFCLSQLQEFQGYWQMMSVQLPMCSKLF